MTPAIHALVMIAATAGSVVICRKHWTRPTVGRVFIAFTLGLGAMFVSIMVSFHMCALGQPFQQWLVPGVALIAILALVGNRMWRRTTAAILVMFMLGLSLHYGGVVHGTDWVGVVSYPAENGGEGDGAREWHTWLTGFYRR